MTTLAGAIDQMLAAGMPTFPPGHPRVNTRIVRYGPKNKGFYRLFEHRARSGKCYISGFFGLFGAIDTKKIEADYADVDHDERQRLARQQHENEAREREKQQRRAAAAANRARMQYDAAARIGASPYLRRKQVSPTKALRFLSDGTLLVPMVDYSSDERVLRGLQKIAPDGSKRFNAGAQKTGAACHLGAKTCDGNPILLTEGLATGLSLVMGAKKRPVFVAFDCGNLMAVATMLRAKYPNSHLVLCADDDRESVCERHRAMGQQRARDPDAAREDWCRCNPGRTHAMRVRNALGAQHISVVWPKFSQNADAAGTDFNDLHVAEGIERVAAQIDVVTPSVPPEAVAPDASDVDAPLNRYVLIYGTETVWDRKVKRIIRVASMRLHVGPEAFRNWQMSPARQTVDERDVVFDPSLPREAPDLINLFCGFETEPAESSECPRLLEELRFLCGDSDAVFDWVLKWMAYPLRHPGAKMQTAIVMYGKEGAGKNQFWGALQQIYGRYAAIIGQSDLESDFNDWASQRLFVIANEVLSRQEMRHQVGKLKNLITEPELQINAKMLPRRSESNHMNLVLFSNEVQPAWIDRNDRRYVIIRTPDPRPASFYAAVGAELAAGGAARLHRYLLDYPLGDFTPHTKPIETAAKHELAELGMTSTQLFWEDLHEGALGIPYCPCLSVDLYAAYNKWCGRNGERAPAKINQFSAQFRSMNGVSKSRERVPLPGTSGSSRDPRMLFRMGERPPDRSDEAWVREGIADFREAVDRYIQGDDR